MYIPTLSFHFPTNIIFFKVAHNYGFTIFFTKKNCPLNICLLTFSFEGVVLEESTDMEKYASAVRSWHIPGLCMGSRGNITTF